MNTKLFLIIIAIFSLLCWSESHAVQIDKESSAKLYLTNIYFVDNVNGWVLGSSNGLSFIYRTTDGGESWSESYRTKEGLFRIKFVNPQTGWCVGSDGTILHTSNGGSSWETQASESKALLTGFAVLDANTAWASGANGTILFTRNGGKDWVAQKTNTNAGISDIAFIDEKRGLAVGYGTILSTKDGGNTWSTKSSGDWKHLSSIAFADEKNGLITVGPVILETSNGSKAYKEIIPSSQGQIVGTKFLDAQRGWVAKSRGVEGDVANVKELEKLSSESFILTTNDGGKNWREMLHIKSDKDHSAWILSVFFVDSLKGWAVGRDGLALKTQDGGRSWEKMPLPPDIKLHK